MLFLLDHVFNGKNGLSHKTYNLKIYVTSLLKSPFTRRMKMKCFQCDPQRILGTQSYKQIWSIKGKLRCITAI